MIVSMRDIVDINLHQSYILGFSHEEFGYIHLRSFQRYSQALLKVFFPSVILVTGIYFFHVASWPIERGR